MLIAVIFGLARVQLAGLGLIIMGSFAWDTVINPLSAILFMAPYRNAVIQLVRRKTPIRRLTLNSSMIRWDATQVQMGS